MGLLSEGVPMSWEETKKYSEHIREHGIDQFINFYEKLSKEREGKVLKWGDEVEYIIVKFDHHNKKAQVSLRAPEILDILQKPKKRGDEDLNSIWVPEYGSYMLEGTPGLPYGGGSISQFNRIEANMKMRRQEAEALLHEDEMIFSITNFPRLGCPKFTFPEEDPEPETSFTRSIFWPNSATFLAHPRFKTLSRNVRERRGEKVAINLPIYEDEFSREALANDPGSKLPFAKEGHVCCDAMGFGMGMSCLQVTFQATNVNEAEILYDQLAPLCPLFLALTAATPTCRGFLVDKDCRWDTIAASVDCRTKQERGEDPLTNDKYIIPKSRYDSISCYISDCALNHNYNDIDLVYDNKIYEKLKNNGIKELLAKHISHLFIRDSISLFSEKLHQDDKKEMDHFENLQSTNWQTMRFKIPPPDSDIGWRVEFRPCELQFTDFENASVICFIVLLTRALLSFNHNLLIPISKVDENMKRAQKRDAVMKELFYFRTNVSDSCGNDEKGPIVKELTIDEIFNGGLEFVGLIPLIKDYLRNLDVETDTMCTLTNYLNFLGKRASGELMTNAKYIRNFVLGHPDYKKDSCISEAINYDLLIRIRDITKGQHKVTELLGKFTTKTKN